MELFLGACIFFGILGLVLTEVGIRKERVVMATVGYTMLIAVAVVIFASEYAKSRDANTQPKIVPLSQSR